jgi:hypothetical protein
MARLFHGPRFSSPSKAGRRRSFPPSPGRSHVPHRAALGLRIAEHPWKKEVHPCVCALWERSSPYAPACCRPAAAGNTGVAIAHSIVPPPAAAAALMNPPVAAVGRAAMPPMKAPSPRLWRLSLAPCRLPSCRGGRINLCESILERSNTADTAVAHCDPVCHGCVSRVERSVAVRLLLLQQPIQGRINRRVDQTARRVLQARLPHLQRQAVRLAADAEDGWR